MSLTPEEAELKTLESTFTAGWDATTYPVVLGDDPFKGPALASWVRFAVMHGTSDRRDLGTSVARFNHPGVITVQCFLSQQGTTSPHWLAAQLRAVVRELFQEKEFTTETGGQVLTYTTSIKRVPPEKSWQRYNITTPFLRIEATP
jgi:hypothetical protein